ncbi:MAG TPA: ubiquinol oxidase subunit II [Candidatus Saccharimonadales bacterium]|nr:ubiquinol oxidase subunit II [Candidatus Saccharimonadales bacterium]
MGKKTKFLWFILPPAGLVALLIWYLKRHTVAVLQPHGMIAQKEQHLFLFGLALSAIVVLPVYVMTVAIAWNYRENNHKPKAYTPDWDGSRLFEGIWWGVPIAIITVLSVVTWQSSHTLDPYRPLNASAQPLTIQVVALDWRWLFIYPEQHVASLNLLEVPVDRPLNFQITSDSVMNSFWIPSLGGQIYAMPGMGTELHLTAKQPGDYHGSSANISGRGFADMDFTARAVSAKQFQQWTEDASEQESLTQSAYDKLARPNTDHRSKSFGQPEAGLFANIIVKYMGPRQEQEL